MTAAEQLADVLLHADDPRPPTADEPIRFSRLKRIGQSPAHYIGARDPESSGIDVGSAAHLMILGGDGLVVAYPGKVRRGKEYDQFAADNEGSLILSRSEFRRAHGMASAVSANRDAMAVLDGAREQTYTWRVQGRLCRGTPDVRGADFLTELKTGETASPQFFPFKVRRFAYHAQLAWYSDGAVLAGLGDPKGHYIVAVEAAPPHVVTVFRIDPKTIDKGRRLARLWFERLLQCEAAGEWPGYSQSIVDLDLPDDEFEMLDAGEVAAARPEWADEVPIT